MSVFCLLWTILFYLFWRSVSPDHAESSGGVWALLLGSIVALVQFFAGPLVSPGGFGIFRWISAVVDIVTLPAILPLGVALLFVLLNVFSSSVNLTNFMLLWLIPSSAMRTVSWSSQNEPTLLVLVPLLWTAIAVGVPFFIRIIRDEYGFVRILAFLGCLVLPFIAATAYWAFFSQRFYLEYGFMTATFIPLAVASVYFFYRTSKQA